MHRYDEDARFCTRRNHARHPDHLAVLLGTIGLISALGLIGTVLAFWSMGRAAYRKD